MLPTSEGVEPAWSPVGRRIQLSQRGQPPKKYVHPYSKYSQTVWVAINISFEQQPLFQTKMETYT